MPAGGRAWPARPPVRPAPSTASRCTGGTKGSPAWPDGPLAPLLRPWLFESLTAAQSGVVDFWSTWKVGTPNADGGWAVFSVADGRDAPFRVGVAEDEQENGIVYRQQDALLFLELPAVQAAEWLVRLHFDGRVDG